MMVHIPVIEDDYRRIKAHPESKVSSLTLKFLRDKRVIRHDHFMLYKLVSECPEARTSVPEKNVVEHVNNRFVDFYESI